MDQGINALVWYWYCVGMDQGGYSDHTPWTLSSAGMQQISTSLDSSSITLIPFKTIQPSSITLGTYIESFPQLLDNYSIDLMRENQLLLLLLKTVQIVDGHDHTQNFKTIETNQQSETFHLLSRLIKSESVRESVGEINQLSQLLLL